MREPILNDDAEQYGVVHDPYVWHSPHVGIMQLSRHTDYMLKVLMYLAARPGDRGTLAQIAEYFQVSLEHLRKVVHELSKMGYVNTFQGKGGGIELARPPDRINVGELFQRLEGGKPMVDCVGLNCRLAPVCTLNNALNRAQRAFIETLSEYSLADLIADKAMFSGLTASA